MGSQGSLETENQEHGKWGMGFSGWLEWGFRVSLDLYPTSVTLGSCLTSELLQLLAYVILPAKGAGLSKIFTPVAVLCICTAQHSLH